MNTDELAKKISTLIQYTYTAPDVAATGAINAVFEAIAEELKVNKSVELGKCGTYYLSEGKTKKNQNKENECETVSLQHGKIKKKLNPTPFPGPRANSKRFRYLDIYLKKITPYTGSKISQKIKIGKTLSGLKFHGKK